jgi:hypothetical protein
MGRHKGSRNRQAEPVVVPPVLESGLGEMSKADKAAIFGTVAEPLRVAEVRISRDVYAEGYNHEPEPLGPPAIDAALTEIVQRLATLEHEFEGFKKAVEAGFKSAAQQRLTQILPAERPTPIASAIEQEAYSRENYRRFQARDPEQPQFGGIGEWQAAGRPGLQ